MDNQPLQHTSKTQSHVSKVRVVLLSIVVLLGMGAAAGIYFWQQDRLDALQKEEVSLQTQLRAKKKANQGASSNDSVDSAISISTENWKQYCDPAPEMYCFKYPADWKLEQSSEKQDFGAIVSSAMLTNPNKTVTVAYGNYDVKDGGGTSAYIMSIDNPTSRLPVKIVGTYVLGSVSTYTSIAVVDGDWIKDEGAIKLGQANLWALPQRFGGNTLSGGPTVKDNENTTREAARNWHSTQDAETVRAILKTLTKN